MVSKDYLFISKALLIFIIFIAVLINTIIAISYVKSRNNPNSSAKLLVENNYDYYLTYQFYVDDISNTKEEYMKSNDEKIYFDKLSNNSKTKIIAKLIVVGLLYLLIFIMLIMFINSAKDHHTFFTNSHRYLNFIALIFIILFIVEIINTFIFNRQDLVMIFSDGEIFIKDKTGEMNILKLLIFLVFTFIALVFGQMIKEGERIKTENNLTV